MYNSLMDFSNKIPQEDFLRAIDADYLEDIQARVDMGWRVRTDMQALINFAREHLETRRRAD
jgi:hypothetical protein